MNTPILSDMLYLMNGVERLAFIVLAVLLLRALFAGNVLPKRIARTVWVVVAIWAFASLMQYAITSFNYLRYTRPAQTEYQRSRGHI